MVRRTIRAIDKSSALLRQTKKLLKQSEESTSRVKIKRVNAAIHHTLTMKD